MAERVVIAGAGGFGRGVLAWLQGSPAHRRAHGITDIVFVDDGAPAVRPAAPVIGTIRDYRPEPDDVVLCAIGSPVSRRAVVTGLSLRGARFHTFVDDRAVLAAGVGIGPGAVVCPGTVVSADARIGAHVHVNFGCAVGHDTVLEDFTTLSPMVNVMGEVRVGEGVFLGGSAVVLPRLALGSSSTVGAGAVVTADLSAGVTVVGNPARPLRKRMSA